MAETGVLLDAAGRHLAPLIAWYDSRGAEQAALLGREVPRFPIYLGAEVSAKASVVKHRWLREAGLLPRPPRRWLNVAEWIVRELGGEEVAEHSLSSRTGYLDTLRVRWRPDLLEWAGMPPGMLAALQPASAAAGRCRIGDARVDGAVLAVGGHDHLCAAVGAGVTEAGEVLASMGTAQALVRTLPEAPPEARVEEAVALALTVSPHALAGRWGSSPAASSAASWPSGRRRCPTCCGGSPATSRRWTDLSGPHRRIVAVGGWSRRPRSWRPSARHWEGWRHGLSSRPDAGGPPSSPAGAADLIAPVKSTTRDATGGDDDSRTGSHRPGRLRRDQRRLSSQERRSRGRGGRLRRHRRGAGEGEGRGVLRCPACWACASCSRTPPSRWS